MKKRNILTRATALAALLMGLATACTPDDLAPNNPTDGGNGPLRLHSLTIEGASNATRTAIPSGSFADGGADPGDNQVRTAFKEGDEIIVVAVCNDASGNNSDNTKTTTATLQPDGSWKMADENLLPGDGQKWTGAFVTYQPVNTELSAAAATTLFGGIATPAITIFGDWLGADNLPQATGGLTITNGAITAELRHENALLTIAPDAITIGGEFAEAGYTHIIGLRGSMNGTTDAGNNNAHHRFPFTAFGATTGAAGGEGTHDMLQAIATGYSRLTTLHVRLAKGTTAAPTEATDWMEIAVMPDAKDENNAPGLKLEGNHRYKLALNLYDEGKMTVTVPTSYPSWGEEQVVESDIFFIKDAATLRQFAAMMNDAKEGDPVLKKNAIVMCSFTLTVSGTDTDTGWGGIGNASNKPYLGTFDGQGHTITLVAPSGTPATQGLFYRLGEGGVVKNITLQGTAADTPAYIAEYSIFVGGSFVGGILGFNEGTVQNCHVRYLSVKGSRTGGIAGQSYNSSSIVVACSATGCSLSIKGTGDGYCVGGIVGYNGIGTIQNSYAAGNVITGDSQAKGLLVGDNGAAVQNCAFITGGGINAIGYGVGSGSNNKGYASATDFNTNAPGTLNTGMPEVMGANGKPQVWLPGTGTGTPAYPVLGDKKPNDGNLMYIYNETDLRAFAAQVNTAKNSSDPVLKMKATVMCSFTLTVNGTGTDTGWGGIGTGNKGSLGYLGIFDGQGCTITLIAPEATPATQGLFYSLGKDGVVKNITLQGTDADNPAYIAQSGDYYAGGIMGLHGGTVQNCHVRYLSIATGNATNTASAGGIAGSSGGNITACSVAACSVKTTGFNARLGGIVGNNYATVQNCYVAGITLTNSANASKGLLVGWNTGASATVKNCAADSESEGGLIDLIGLNEGGTDDNNNRLDPADFNTDALPTLNIGLTPVSPGLPGIIGYRWDSGTATNGAYQDAASNYYPVTIKN